MKPIRLLTEDQIQPGHKRAPASRFSAMRRLQRMAAHLQNQKAKHHRTFNFAFIVGPSPSEGPSCGTAGCAVGELPYAFPRVFGLHSTRNQPDRPNRVSFLSPMDRSQVIVGNSTYLCEDFEATACFFGLSKPEVMHLFSNNTQDHARYGGLAKLGEQTTAEQVAHQINCFISKRYGDLLAS